MCVKLQSNKEASISQLMQHEFDTWEMNHCGFKHIPSILNFLLLR